MGTSGGVPRAGVSGSPRVRAPGGVPRAWPWGGRAGGSEGAGAPGSPGQAPRVGSRGLGSWGVLGWQLRAGSPGRGLRASWAESSGRVGAGGGSREGPGLDPLSERDSLSVTPPGGFSLALTQPEPTGLTVVDPAVSPQRASAPGSRRGPFGCCFIPGASHRTLHQAGGNRWV